MAIERKGVLFGVIHGKYMKPGREAAEKEVANNRLQKLCLRKAIEQLDLLKPEDKVAIEKIGLAEKMGWHNILTLIAEEARKRNLKVVHFAPDEQVEKRVAGARIDFQLAEAMAGIRGALDEHAKRAINDAERTLFTGAEIRTNFLIKTVRNEKPKLVFAGAKHIMDAAPFLKGYKNKTPLRLKLKAKALHTINTLADEAYYDISKKMQKHRKKTFGQNK